MTPIEMLQVEMKDRLAHKESAIMRLQDQLDDQRRALQRKSRELDRSNEALEIIANLPTWAKGAHAMIAKSALEYNGGDE